MTRLHKHQSVLLPLCFLLAGGCSWIPFYPDGETAHRGPPRIADIVADLPELEMPQAVAAKPTREEVLAAYDRVYGLIPDVQENHSVGKRLADLKMGVGEDLDIECASIHFFGFKRGRF